MAAAAVATNTSDAHQDTPTPSSPSSHSILIRVSFNGGLELLFNDERHHSITLPLSESSHQPTIADLIALLAATFHSHIPKSRRDLFSLNPQEEQDMQDAEGLSKDADGQRRKGVTVRPGILVLVNDADWELEEERETVLEEGDEVVFVSTLHGG